MAALVAAPNQGGRHREAGLTRVLPPTLRGRAASPGRDHPRLPADGWVVGQVEQVGRAAVIELDQLAARKRGPVAPRGRIDKLIQNWLVARAHDPPMRRRGDPL